MSIGPAQNLYLNKESETWERSPDLDGSKEDSIANTVNSGRVSDERTIFREGLETINEKSSEATLKQDGPQVLLVENNLVFALGLNSQLSQYGVRCDLAFD